MGLNLKNYRIPGFFFARFRIFLKKKKFYIFSQDCVIIFFKVQFYSYTIKYWGKITFMKTIFKIILFIIIIVVIVEK